jgi:hypothetical protein
MAWMMVVIAAAGAVGSTALASMAGEVSSPAQKEQSQVCKTVVSAEPGAKPQQLCMTRAEWDAKKIADAKDPNRIVCRYEEVPGSRFRSQKICQPASEWANQRQLQRQEIERVQMGTQKH